MAEELKIKVRVDSSDVQKGTDDAKRKVRQAADEMKKEVSSSSEGMKDSFKKVADSTNTISDAANKAGSAVRNLESTVAQSSGSMEKNLAKVSRQMSAMQMFTMGARGVRMVGGIAENIAKLNGATAAAEGINTVTNVGSSALQGAATGWIMTGGNPIGAAVGGLVGAGSALLDAAVKQKEAAEKQLEAARASTERSKQTIETIDADVRARNRRQRAETIANMPEGAFDERFAQSEIDKAKAVLQRAEARQNLIQDMMYGRNGVETIVSDWGKALGYKNAKYFSIAGSEMSLDDLPENLGVVNWMDPNKESEKLVPALIARHIAEKFRDPFVDKILGTEDREGREGIDRWINDNLAWPIMHHFYRIPKASFDGIVADLFKTLEEKALDAAKQVADAQQRLDELAPIQARLDKERAASKARMDAPLNFNDDEWGPFDNEKPTDGGWFDMATDAMKRREAAELNLASGTDLLKSLQSRLAGIYSMAASPTDALTKIGGGVGYTSYNNSVLTVTKSIEKSLNTLIANQLRQNEEIRDEIANLKFLEATWQ